MKKLSSLEKSFCYLYLKQEKRLNQNFDKLLSFVRRITLSDGEKKPTLNIDLKSRLGAINAQKPTQTMNPFGTQTLNPFGAKPSFSLDPKPETTTENAPASPPPVASPFVSPLGSMTNNAAVSSIGSPLSSPSQPAVTSNPFTATPATPTQTGSFSSTSTSAFGSSSFSSSFASTTAPQVTANAFNTTAAEPAAEEEEKENNGWGMDIEQADFDPALAQNNSYDFASSTDYWPKKTVKSMLIVTGVVVLVIGLLFGLNISERRNFNYRIESWKNIKGQLDVSFKVLNDIDVNVKDILKSKEILWKKIEAIPNSEEIKPIPTTILVSKTTLDKDGMQQLSSMVIALNQLFELTLEYKSFALGMKSELSGNSFEQNSQFAVYAPDFFSSCIKAGKFNCPVPPVGAIGGNIIAITSREFISKDDGKYLQAVTRTDRNPREVNVNYLISVPKSEVVVGFGGENAINSYTLRLRKVMEKLKEVNDIKSKLDVTLKERTEQSPIFSL